MEINWKRFREMNLHLAINELNALLKMIVIDHEYV